MRCIESITALTSSKNKNFFLLIAVAVVAIVGILGGLNWFPNHWSFTKSVEVSQGPFYRMVVKLDYKGQPRTFDFVVACSVSRTFYQDNSSSYEPALVPSIYGHKMDDGKAVLIRPPVLCHGETSANKEVPEAFMPLIVVYENAETLDEGYAYLSDDAYASPLSDLKFGSTEVTASNLEDFQTFMKEGVPNVVTRERYWSAQSDVVIKERGFSVPAKRYAKRCELVARWRLPESIRKKAREFWPIDRPQFWYPMNYPEDEAVRGNLFNTNKNEKDETLWMQAEYGSGPSFPAPKFKHSTPDGGMARRGVKGFIGDPKYRRREADQPLIAYYPVWSELRQSRWPQDKSKWQDFVSSLSLPDVRKIELANGKRLGFAACWSVPILELDRASALAKVPGATVVDDIRVGGSTLMEQQAFNGPEHLLERDEYLYEFQQFDFGIPGGDVK